jgi:hypothetical protein
VNTKRTDQLVPGDRVKLANGLVRTVAEIADSGYRNNGGKTIWNVTYREPAVPGVWSDGNSAVGYSMWELA